MNICEANLFSSSSSAHTLDCLVRPGGVIERSEENSLDKVNNMLLPPPLHEPPYHLYLSKTIATSGFKECASAESEIGWHSFVVDGIKYG